MTTDSPSGIQRRKVPVRYYRFRNSLKEKALGGRNPSGPGAISPEALAAAESEFDKMSEDYPDWVQGALQKLYEQHGRCVDTPEQRHPTFKRIHEMAHDLKGQGGTFGYDLVSSFADSLYEFTHGRDVYGDAEVDLIKSHIDAMKAVIGARIKGDGGKVGKELMGELHKAIARYQQGGDDADPARE